MSDPAVDPGSDSPKELRPRNVYVFGATSFFNDTASEMAYWVLPAFLASLGVGPEKLGFIEGIAGSIAFSWVTAIVLGCTDADVLPKPPWRERDDPSK